MGRSVMTLSGAEAIAYRTFDLDQFEDYFEDDFDLEKDWIIDQLKEAFPSLSDDTGWIGRELQIILSNEHSVVTISSYNGLVAVCLGAKYDRNDYFADPSEHAGIGKRWREQVADKFTSLLSEYTKIGTFSNGESIYQTITK